jgi:ATP-dependent Clp protease adapter protein ClpS
MMNTNDCPQLDTLFQVSLEPMYQVILFNDDINDCDYVVGCLISIFKHPLELAVKIMIEAHESGRAIAEVESKELAIQHTAALHRAGLDAKAEPI